MGKIARSKKKDTRFFETPDLDLVNYLTLQKFEPIDRVTRDAQAFLIYERTEELDKSLIDYMNRCTTCGIIFKDVGPARAKARSLLMDGLPDQNDNKGNRP